jgi:hypothetical protein
MKSLKAFQGQPLFSSFKKHVTPSVFAPLGASGEPVNYHGKKHSNA